MAFVDDPMPDGLLASLERIQKTMPVTVIALKGAGVKVGQLPRYETDDHGFDVLGISVTPQFYLVREAKIVQAWQGFRNDDATRFEHEIAETVKGN